MKKSFMLPLALSVTVGLGSPEVLRPLSFKDLKRVGAVGDSDRTAKEPQIENVKFVDAEEIPDNLPAHLYYPMVCKVVGDFLKGEIDIETEKSKILNDLDWKAVDRLCNKIKFAVKKCDEYNLRHYRKYFIDYCIWLSNVFSSPWDYFNEAKIGKSSFWEFVDKSYDKVEQCIEKCRG